MSALALWTIQSLCLAQNPQAVEMADAFRASGKIYVVVVVMLIVFVGILALLWRIEQRLKRLENEK